MCRVALSVYVLEKMNLAFAKVTHDGEQNPLFQTLLNPPLPPQIKNPKLKRS